MKADEILRRAAELVGGERAQQHGDMEVLHNQIAEFWNAYANGTLLSAESVAWMMVLLKMSRARYGKLNMDDFIDAAAYCAIAGQLASEEAEE